MIKTLDEPIPRPCNQKHFYLRSSAYPQVHMSSHSNTMNSVLGILFMTVILTPLFPMSFADHVDAVIDIPEGASSLGYESTNECFVPSYVTIDAGGTVTWTNNDIVAYTIIGSPLQEGSEGLFESGRLLPGDKFSVAFDVVKPGTYTYSSMPYPWCVGTVSVSGNGTADASIPASVLPLPGEETGTIMLTGSENPDVEAASYTISGGNIISIVPMVISNEIMPWAGGSLVVTINAIDDGYVTLTIPRIVADSKSANGADLEYLVIVDGEGSDFEESKTDNARTLTIDFVAGTEKIEIIGTFVVPEFGTMTTMVLVVAVVSMIATSMRSKL